MLTRNAGRSNGLTTSLVSFTYMRFVAWYPNMVCGAGRVRPVAAKPAKKGVLENQKTDTSPHLFSYSG
nr:hypothetical protein CFP56_55017 [Quercus suber]